MRHVTAYLVSAAVFGLMDALWLRSAMPWLYRPDMGPLLAREMRMTPALIFYALYLGGILYFAISPALAAQRANLALIHGAVFGFMCYMTYDLTNHAVMAQWSVRLSVIDILWGTVATATAAFVGAWAAIKLFPAP